MWNLKHKKMNITKKKQTHRYRKHTRGKGGGADRGRGLRGTNYYV